MILIDSRIGSSHYAQHLGAQAELVQLDYGDIAFNGNSATGPITIGIEVKKLNDALACMVDGRFTGHQVPGLVQHYDRAYLLIEGIWRPDPNSGVLQIGLGSWDGGKFGGAWRDASAGYQRFTYRQFTGWLETVSAMANIKILRSNSELETVSLVLSLYQWWQKEWKEHRSLQSFHEERPNSALLTRPSLVRRIASELPGIGWTRSGAVARTFGTVREMVNAPAEVWAEIEGIGKGIATKVVKAIRGEQ